jgi:capsid protein
VWRTIQAWWETNFLCVVYEEWLKMSLLVGALKFDSRDPNRFMEHKWTHRGWTWVDPLKDTQAGVLGVQNGLVSRTMLLAEQGLDFEDVLEQLAEEKRMADEAGISLVAPAPAANDKKDAADSEDDSGEEDAAPKKKKDNARTFRNRIEALMNGSNHE